MKRKIALVLIGCIVLMLLGCSGGNPADPGGDNPSNPGEAVTAGLPSWLANKSWEGTAEHSTAGSSPYEIKTSDDDIFVPSTFTSNGETTFIYGLGFKASLKSLDVDYDERTDSMHYSIQSGTIRTTTTANGYTQTNEYSAGVSIEKVNDIQIRLTITNSAATVTLTDPEGHSETTTYPGVTITGLMTRK